MFDESRTLKEHAFKSSNCFYQFLCSDRIECYREDVATQ